MIASYYSEFIVLIVALLNYRKLKGSHMIWFIPFLLVTFLIEISSYYLYLLLGLSSHWVYNLLVPITAYFYGFIFYRQMSAPNLKLPFKIIGQLYLLANFYFLFTTNGFNKTALLTSAILMMILSCYYFYRCLLDDTDLDSAQVKSGLWIASGVLIFYAGISIVFSLFDYIQQHDLKIAGYHLYNVMPGYLSIILYACISIALIKWKKPQEI